MQRHSRNENHLAFYVRDSARTIAALASVGEKRAAILRYGV